MTLCWARHLCISRCPWWVDGVFYCTTNRRPVDCRRSHLQPVPGEDVEPVDTSFCQATPYQSRTPRTAFRAPRPKDNRTILASKCSIPNDVVGTKVGAICSRRRLRTDLSPDRIWRYSAAKDQCVWTIRQSGASRPYTSVQFHFFAPSLPWLTYWKVRIAALPAI